MVTNRNELKKGTPAGHRIRHKTQMFGMYLIPLLEKPFPKPDLCPTCKVVHNCKTVHLHLEGNGTCIISQGVLESIGSYRLEIHGFEYDQVVVEPPPLNLAQYKSRAEADHANRAITILGQAKKGKANG